MFNYLLLNHLRPGKIEFSENGFGFKVNPADDESVLFFQTDLDSCFQTKFSTRACDCLLFRVKNFKQIRLVFIELKGGDYTSAEDQLFKTITIIKKQLKSDFKNINEIFAYIVTNSSVPLDLTPIRWRFKKAFNASVDLIRTQAILDISAKISS